MLNSIFLGFLVSFVVVKTFILFKVLIQISLKTSKIVTSETFKRLKEERKEIVNNFFDNKSVMHNYISDRFVKEYNDLTKNPDAEVGKEIEKAFDKYLSDTVKVITAETFIEVMNKVYTFESSTPFENGSKLFWKNLFSTSVWKLIDTEYLEAAYAKAKKELEE